MGLLKSLFTNCAHPEGTDGTCYAEIYEPDACSADELGAWTHRISGWLDDARRCRVRADGNPSEEADVRHDSWCKVTQKSR